MSATKKDSIKLNRLHGNDIYLDPDNGLFYFTTGKNHERVVFTTLREAEHAALGDREPVRAIKADSLYGPPRIIEIIGASRWNFVDTQYRRVSTTHVYAYDKQKFQRLFDTTIACQKAHQEWQHAREELGLDGGDLSHRDFDEIVSSVGDNGSPR